MQDLLPHSLENINCFKSGVGYSRFIEIDTANELLTQLLRQLNFRCE